MKNIICYGDSNTFGFDAVNFGRLSEEDRWCGIIAEKLKDKAAVKNFGLNGRTIMTDDLVRPDRNAYKSIEDDIKGEHFDLIVIMLGTNDCKFDFRLSPEEIARHMRSFIGKVKEIVKNTSPSAEILLVSPVPMNERCVVSPLEFDMTSCEVSKALEEKFRIVAEEENIRYADAGGWNVELSHDGCHYTSSGHRTFAENIINKIYDIL